MTKSLLRIAGVGLSAFSAMPMVNGQDHRPNILWIIADDLGTDLACYGNSVVRTPNTDLLASGGMTFMNTFTVVPVSSPSRSCLMTGMYPVSIDCNQHRTLNKDPLPAGVVPVTEYFRKAGYWVSNGDATKFGRTGKTDYNFTFDGKLFDGPDWSGRKPGQPFFAQMQIHYPHRPFEADERHPVDPGKVEVSPVYPDHQVTRADFAMYLESVQHADECVGLVLKKLEEDGLIESTIVMFFGDQGRPMVRAKQFLYDEGIHTPLIIKFPDGRSKGKKVSDLVSLADIPATSLKLAGISIPAYMQGQNIFSSKKRQYIFTTRDRMDETVDRMRSVRTKDLKYIKNYYPERPYTQFNMYKVTMYPVLTLMKIMYKKGELSKSQSVFMSPVKEPEELYNLRKDPYELNNLAGDPAYARDLKKLRSVLETWVSTNDKGKYPEDDAEVSYWKDDSEKAYVTKMKSYGLPPDISDEDYLKWWELRLKSKKP
ncbi:MAG TPA: sulfatase [Bacteroidales bacterium]|jgi:uncharacterized sulfatase|nr:sulfatase [Bacteroidales bacterium]